MNWKEILKTEKGHCGSEKTDEEKPIIEKIPDLSGDGEVTRKDVLIGRGVYDKQGNKVKKAKGLRLQKKIKCPKCKGKGCSHCDDKGYHISKGHKSDSQIEKEILAEIKKEGGALGMKNLKPICPSNDLERVLNSMKKKGTIFIHRDGDIYTHKPSRGRGFTA